MIKPPGGGVLLKFKIFIVPKSSFTHDHQFSTVPDNHLSDRNRLSSDCNRFYCSRTLICVSLNGHFTVTEFSNAEANIPL